MNKYKILKHPSDLKLKVFGKTKEELLINALEGMFLSMKPKIKKSQRTIKREFQIKSLDFPSLLIDFLSEALYLSDLYNEVYLEAEIKHLGDKRIEGKFLGKKIESIDLEIKAVTYHNLKIRKTNQHWEAVILFDI